MQEQTIAGFWLSPQQKLAWKLETEVLHAGARSVCSVAISGAVDPDRLKSAVSAVIARHEILRTTFRRQTGMKLPFQVVLDVDTPVWEDVDCSAQTEPAAEIQKVYSREHQVGANAEDAAALRVVFVRETNTSSTLILSLSGLCGDAASFRPLAHEIALLYAGKDELPEPFRYVQFAQWQLDLLESDSEDEQRGRDFWKKQAVPEYPALTWAAKGANDFKPEVHRLQTTGNVGALSQKSDAAPVLLSAWAALMGRLSGQTAFSLGVAASSREFEELENAIGCFERTLPISFDIQSHFSFSDVQRRTREAVDQSVAVQEYFASESHDPEAVSFAYRDLGSAEEIADVRFELERVYVISERFKLRLVAVRRGSELTLEFHYDSSRLSRSVV
ncbi:MAG TPA: condensation domain-containing protein, partial [Terriglobales bacterium]|nr:condensation domain-containing protein [Terriglobales bacterium]